MASLLNQFVARFAAVFDILDIKTATIFSRLVGARAYPTMDLAQGVVPSPREYKESAKDNDVHIFVYHGSSDGLKLHEVLKSEEFDSTPLVNPKFFEEDVRQTDLSRLINLVFIMNFFECGADFVYYVRGKANISKFMAATFSGRPYQRPMFATPISIHDAGALFAKMELEFSDMEQASKTDTKGLRWKYLYESGIRAWDELEFSWEKLADIREVSRQRNVAGRGGDDATMVDSIPEEQSSSAGGSMRGDEGKDTAMKDGDELDSETSSPSISNLALSDDDDE